MKPPKCRLCQKEHWATQRCGAKKVNRESSSQIEDAPVIGEGVDGSRPSGNVGAPRQELVGRAQETSHTPLPELAPGPLTTTGVIGSAGGKLGHAERLKSPKHGEGAKGTQDLSDPGKKEPPGLRPPLTPAEKQKAYRQRIKDDPERYQKYLESERMRKRNG